MSDERTINIAFFDSEFTATSANNRGMQEMIQFALVIYECEKSGDDIVVRFSEDPIYTYSEFVKPTYQLKLSDYIKKLTGIKQDDVNDGATMSEAIDTIYNAIVKNNVKRTFVWGPDEMMLRKNFGIIEHDKKKTNKILRTMKDVSSDISKAYGFETPVSQHKMCELLKVEEKGRAHDAYYDALNLFRILNSFSGKIPVEYILK